jgi:hypothetical protein
MKWKMLKLLFQGWASYFKQIINEKLASTKFTFFGKVSYENILFLKYSYPPKITNSKTTIYDLIWHNRYPSIVSRLSHMLKGPFKLYVTL